MPDISKLLTADQLSKKLGGKISPDRLNELASSHLLPHYEYEGGFLFGCTEALTWINDNLLTHVAGNPIPNCVNITPVLHRPAEVVMPSELRGIAPFLIPLPIQSLGHAVWSGVYFLCCEGKVVYVGQSIVVAGRVGAHMGDKEFDWAFCMRVPRSDLDFVEGEFIRALKPKYNYSINGTIISPRRPADTAFGLNMLSMLNQQEYLKEE